MSKSKTFFKNVFIARNLLMAMVLVNLLVIGNLLQFTKEFILGMVTGFVLVWVVYFISGLIKIRKSGFKVPDERDKMIFNKAVYYTFWTSNILLMVAMFLFYSPLIHFKINIGEALAFIVLMNKFIYLAYIAVLRRKY